MAKAPTAAAPEVTDLTKIGDLVGTLDRPKTLDPNDLYGTEGIGMDDLRLPRLAIAQGLSTQLIPDDSSYIKGLTLFDLFNDLSGEIYGRGPLTFVPVKRDVVRIEFDPDDMHLVLDRDVPAGDPRLKWGPRDAEGKSTPPKATTFVEFVVLLLKYGKMPEPIVLSIKTTNKFQTRAAEQLTAFIKFRQAPIYAGIYQLTSKPEKNDSGTFGVFVPKNAGFIPKDTPAGAALYDHCEKFAKSLEGRNIQVNRDTSDPDSFNPNEIERNQTEM